MSFARPYALSRTVALAAVFMLATVLLPGCGFRPLHGQDSNVGVTEKQKATLADVSIIAVKDRIGQELHNHLLDLLTPNGRPLKPRYSLRIELTESKESLSVQKSSFATRANLRQNAKFKLYNIHNGSEDLSKPAFSGVSLAVSSYNILDSDFATLMAEKKARSLAARDIADDIRLRLAIFLSQRQN